MEPILRSVDKLKLSVKLVTSLKTKIMDLVDFTMKQQEAISSLEAAGLPGNLPRIEKVVCAALMVDGDLVIGVRHYDPAMRQQLDRLVTLEYIPFNLSDAEVIEGFITTEGRFVDREEAARIFKVYNNSFEGDGLSSEDLY